MRERERERKKEVEKQNQSNNNIFQIIFGKLKFVFHSLNATRAPSLNIIRRRWSEWECAKRDVNGQLGSLSFWNSMCARRRSRFDLSASNEQWAAENEVKWATEDFFRFFWFFFGRNKSHTLIMDFHSILRPNVLRTSSSATFARLSCSQHGFSFVVYSSEVESPDDFFRLCSHDLNFNQPPERQ